MKDIKKLMDDIPREAVREAIYNALGHNNYAASIPIQIRIEDDAMYISNNCILPKNWTVETLMEPHKSEPFNPSIANAFYRAGYIEAWGRGIQKICEACRELGTADPEYTARGDDLTVKFTALESAKISDPKIPKHQESEANAPYFFYTLSLEVNFQISYWYSIVSGACDMGGGKYERQLNG